jgi:hypothetical protein
MKRILFVDHDFHLMTRSSDFFVELLGKAFDVDKLHLPPRAITNADDVRVPSGIDAVVVWQLDHLAPIFLAQGYPTIIVPMFDGSNALPDLHWALLRPARFVNFSLFLHARLRQLQCTSLLVKYFPPPKGRVASFSSLRAFLWQRRPQEGFDVGLVERLFGAGLNTLQVHDAPDERQKTHRFKSRLFDVSYSTWFEEKGDYLTALERANVFIAPREAEGIGHAFLEAMARGMLVVANARPTHTEYICDGLNGMLFDWRRPHLLDVDGAAELGRRAWETVVEGHAKWMRQVPQMMQFIKDCERPDGANLRPLIDDFSLVSKAFYENSETYERVLKTVLRR